MKNRHFDPSVINLDGDVIGLQITGKLNDNLYVERSWLDYIDKSVRPILVITTTSGDLESALELIHAVKARFEAFDLYVPRVCQGAGMLLAVSANRIFMHSEAYLGPLLNKPRAFRIVSGFAQRLGAANASHFLGWPTNGVGVENRLSLGRATEIATTLRAGQIETVSTDEISDEANELERARQYVLSVTTGNLLPGKLDELLYKMPPRYRLHRGEASEYFVDIDEPAGDVAAAFESIRSQPFEPDSVYTVIGPYTQAHHAS